MPAEWQKLYPQTGLRALYIFSTFARKKYPIQINE